MFDFDDDMKVTFLEEAQSLLDDSEAAFMALDEGDRSPELVDKIFRLAHNFKSSAKTVGLPHLSQFAHVFEDVLTKIKKNEIVPDKAVCTILLETLDHFKSYVAGLKQDTGYQHDTTQALEVLNELLRKAESSTPPTEVLAEPPASASTSSDQIVQEPVEAAAPIETALDAEIPTGAALSVDAIAELEAAPIALVRSSPPSPPAASAPPRVPRAEDETLKVNRKKIDDLLNLVGELVVNQSMISDHREHGSLESEASHQVLNAMKKLIHEIQDLSMSLRLLPIAPLFQKLKRIARDAGGELEKTIQFVTEGEDVEVDKVILEKMGDPLTHLVRNAVDHGIETDPERELIGKPPAIVTLSAQQKEDRIVLTLSDNGRGMNAERILAKAVEKGLVTEQETLSEEAIYELIFRPGFSTKEAVTDMSGRGVGMDVVKRAVEDLRGTIQIQTKFGAGTQFIISLPLSMSIISGMVVGIGNQKYVVPVSQLVETVKFNQFKIESSTGQGRMFNLRGEVIPILSLATILQKSGDHRSPADPRGLIASHAGRKVSFEIDEIFGQQQIVLKKLGHEMRDLPGIVAGAILSTGEPGIVLNLTELAHLGETHVA